GLDGVVCAPGEIELIRADLPDDFFYVTPGTRSPGGSGNDHKRTGTHAQALAAGSSLLVVGRRINQAADRRQAAAEVLRELREATA
ncbi:orotidine 5'-phosphate decarboxylase / HUMPS family protein, partial [Streptomyces sp. SAS_269]